MKKSAMIYQSFGAEYSVAAENVTKRYSGAFSAVPAVDNVSFKIRRGEFIAITGTSGSGKSTLLHLLGGVDKPTSGKVYINGLDIYSLTDKQLADFRCREIGIVYQFFNLIPVLNVEENIAFPMMVSEKNPDMKKVAKLIEKLGLTGREYNLPSGLSGGQQQRAAIGRALIKSPSLILADEPTGNLDSRTGKEVMELLVSACRDENKTLIVITHDEKITASADRILRIEDGKIVSAEESE